MLDGFLEIAEKEKESNLLIAHDIKK